MKLTRKQELALIDIGLKTLLNGLVSNEYPKRSVSKPKRRKRQWTEAQRKKFSATMRKKWAEKAAEN